MKMNLTEESRVQVISAGENYNYNLQNKSLQNLNDSINWRLLLSTELFEVKGKVEIVEFLSLCGKSKIQNFFLTFLIVEFLIKGQSNSEKKILFIHFTNHSLR